MNPAILIVAAAGLMVCSAAAQEPGLQVEYFQEAAYGNELTTFAVKCEPNEPISVMLNGKHIHAAVPETDTIEMFLPLTEPGILSIRQKSATATFHVIGPDHETSLHEKDGYLYSTSGPVILLAAHLAPRKHSRKWEALRLFKNLFKDERIQIRSAVVIGAPYRNGINSDKLAELGGTIPGFWTCIQPTVGLKQIDALAAALIDVQPADIAVLSLSDIDLERNMDECQFQIKLEWCLQALKHKGFEHRTFVVPPPLNSRQQKRFKDTLARLNTVCHANNSAWTNMPDPMPESAPDSPGASALLHELSRFVRW